MKVLSPGHGNAGPPAAPSDVVGDLLLQPLEAVLERIGVETTGLSRTDRVSLFSVGPLTNRLLLAGIAFELALTAVAIYLPAAPSVLNTRPLRWQEMLVLSCFPAVVWGVDELYRFAARSRTRE